MDNPGGNLFQNGDLNLNTSRNEEEEEDLEDQKRRNEELQNLLMTKLDDFNYDESTVNSSMISAVSCDDNQNKYLKTENQYEQLKVLYEIRLRELQAVKEEFKETTEKMTKDIDVIKKKLLLSEAELEQLKVSYKNSDALLVEKTAALKELTSVLESKERQIQEHQKAMEHMHIEIATYKATINDLHIQLLADKNPISNINKKYNSEEYKLANQEQINRLEGLLEEKVSTVKLLEKENIVLKEELNKLINTNNDDATLIKALTNNFEGAQKQCEELIDVVETLTNENKHLQERVTNIYSSSMTEKSALDNSNLVHNVDKLSKMLIDKSVQIESLNIKLRNYEENLKELLEYRQLKSDSYHKEFQQCDNKDHTKNLLLMQTDLQNYRRIIEDKNQQILNLNSTNKDLLAKMEETLSQTRTDIKNFSTKYSLPQLEKMAEDLRKAQDRISYLEKILRDSEEKRSELEKNSGVEEQLKKEIETLKLISDKERHNFQNEIKKLQHELEVSSSELKSVKKYTDELVNENVKLKSQPKLKEHEDECLKTQYLESIKSVYEARSKIQSLQETVDELTNLRTMAEGEKCTLECELKDYRNEVQNSKRYIENLEVELDNTVKEIKAKEEILHNLEGQLKSLKEQQDVTNVKKELENAQKELANKEDVIKNLQETMSNLQEQLTAIQNVETSEESKGSGECLKCKANQENMVKNSDDKKEIETFKRIGDELEVIEELEEAKSEEAYKVSLEIQLREEIEKDYFKKLQEVEENYKKMCDSNKDLHQEQEEKLKTQETKFREHLATILRDCTEKIKEYEQARQDMVRQIRELQSDFDGYKIRSMNKERDFKKLIEDVQINSKRDVEKWQLSSRKLINSFLKIEVANKRSRDNIFSKMHTYDAEIAVTDKFYNEKIEKLKKSKKKK